MIIAAYAGVGKTYFCNQNPNAIDLVCMPFKYTNLFDMPDSQADSGEQVKASLDLELRKNWILYYYWMIKLFAFLLPGTRDYDSYDGSDFGFPGCGSDSIYGCLSR